MLVFSPRFLTLGTRILIYGSVWRVECSSAATSAGMLQRPTRSTTGRGPRCDPNSGIQRAVAEGIDLATNGRLSLECWSARTHPQEAEHGHFSAVLEGQDCAETGHDLVYRSNMQVLVISIQTSNKRNGARKVGCRRRLCTVQ